MIEINEEKAQEEINAIKGKTAHSVCVRLYPYNSLDDRDFEILIWRLFSEDVCSFYIENDVSVKLMEGVCDHGRDVTFKKNDKYICVVQCKNYGTKYTYPDFLEELTKVITYYIIESKENDLERYIMVTPEGCTSPVSKFIDEKNDSINEEAIKHAVDSNIKKFTLFKELSYEIIKERLLSCIKRITIDVFTSHDLDYRLLKYPSVARQFFELNSIIDIPSFKNMLDDYRTNIETSYISVRKKDYGAKKAKTFSSFINDMLSGEPYPEMQEYINQNILSKLTDATIEARGLYSLMVENSFEPIIGSGKFSHEGGTTVMYSTINSRSSDIIKPQVLTFLKELERRQLIYISDYDDEEKDIHLNFRIDDYEDLIKLIRTYCKTKAFDFDDIFVRLDFSYFD